ncbi:MAG: DUF2961 domain-containing protein [Anaerolineae bacterium]|nr:DUF2961 domain-containing protein [Anaerolineae bacterium]
MPTGTTTLRSLLYPRDAASKRASSWDRTGGNKDSIAIPRGEVGTLAEIAGPGCINHIWFTVWCPDRLYLRKLLLRMYWDGEPTPSVESPLGDFFGVGHGVVSHYWSLPLNMVTGPRAERWNTAAMNCFFPMPFSRGARVEIANECDEDVQAFYYYIDYEAYPAPADDLLRFHAQWRRENPTQGAIDPHAVSRDEVMGLVNVGGQGNYVILEAEGRGHYVGCNLSIDHINPVPTITWFGEGDDMIFIDGEEWPPSLHGTGTEDYFCSAWDYPAGKHCTPYHGVSLAGKWLALENDVFSYAGKWTMYRFHIEDPVRFARSIRVTIEHGHANWHSNDYSSVAYWYQTEPHRPFAPIVPVDERLPIPERESLKRYFQTI